MDRRYTGWPSFVKQDISHLLCSAKFYVVVSAVAVGMLTCFGGVRDYLKEAGEIINPIDLYIVGVSNRVSLWIIYIGTVVMVCDAPFRYKGDISRIIGTSRKAWMTGQIVFSGLCILLYQAILLIFFCLLTAGYWDFSSEWSEVTLRAAREGSAQIGIVFGIRVWPSLLQLSPITAGFASFLLQVLMGVFLATLLSLLHIVQYSKVGLVLCALFPMFDYLLFDAFDFQWCRILAYLISPFSFSSLSRLRPVSSYGVTFTYAALYLSCATTWLIIWLYKRVHTYDFFSVE